MQPQEFHYRWQWQLRSSPEKLWPLVTDTNRFNKDTGLPAYADEETVRSNRRLSNGRRLRIHLYGMPLDWIEEPFEWIRPYRFGVVRRYQPGFLPFMPPLAEMRVSAELTPRPDGGTRLVYEVWARPRNPLGYLAIPLQIGFLSARRFSAVFQEYDRMAATDRAFFEVAKRSGSLAPGGRVRLAQLRASLIDREAPATLVNRLIELIEEADDLTLQRMRPYALADYWGVPRRQVLELSLLATRLGLLDFQWDLLCPLCRRPKDSVSSLGELKRRVHCDTCHIDYTVNFSRSVELTFRPNPTIRSIEGQVEFCTGGPQVTPHIALQQMLPPGGRRSVAPRLEVGRYRLRALDLPGGQFLQVTADGRSELTLCAGDGGWPGDEQRLAPKPQLHLKNETEREQLFILERMAWADTAVTAAEVTAMQRFRDLFAEEALRPGDKISVGRLTVLFTDLCDSTRLYQEIGDATAFGLVMDHFDVLREAITAEGGAMVKTIGDAVMAVFRRPVAALRAISAAQDRLRVPPPGKRPLLLKAALHQGPSIAVTLNERLDYFGSTVNIASRLEKFSQGGEIVVSETVYNDPEVGDFLAQKQDKLCSQPFEELLKGFGEESFNLWRIKMVEDG